MGGRKSQLGNSLDRIDIGVKGGFAPKNNFIKIIYF